MNYRGFSNIILNCHGFVSPEKIEEILSKQKYIRDYFSKEENKNKIFVNYKRLGFQDENGNSFPIEKAISLGMDHYKELNALYVYLYSFGDLFSTTTPLDNIRSKNKEPTVRQEYCSDEEHSIEGDLISWLGSNVGFDYVRQFLLASGYEINKIEK